MPAQHCCCQQPTPRGNKVTVHVYNKCCEYDHHGHLMNTTTTTAMAQKHAPHHCFLVTQL